MQAKGHIHISLPKDIFALLTNRVLFRLGFGLVGVFIPIFLYELFDKSLYALVSIYILTYVIGIVLQPIGARLLGVLGVRKLLLLSVPFAPLSVGALYYAEYYPLAAVGTFIIGTTLFRILYWVPYHTDLAHLLGHAHRGAQLAVYKNVLQVMNAITPLAGGVLITAFGFGNVFLFASFAFVTTIVPTYFIKEVYEKYSWGWRETFVKLFALKNRSLLYAYMSDGAQSVVSSVVWPVFIFELLGGDYTSVGFITSLTIVVILVLNVVVGKFIDRVGDERALMYSSVLAATGWIVKVFVESALQIFVIDTYHRLGRAANRMSFDAATYEHSADNGHYVDEFTTLKEMALSLGRALMLVLVLVLMYYLGNIRAIFIFAAGATLLMVLLNKQMNIR